MCAKMENFKTTHRKKKKKKNDHITNKASNAQRMDTIFMQRKMTKSGKSLANTMKTSDF